MWFGGVLILQQFFMEGTPLFNQLGFKPREFLFGGSLWQPFTYMFLHSQEVFHILFNMIILWWLGSELEVYWGKKLFIGYYIFCGVFSVLFYTLVLFCLSFFFPKVHLYMQIPVVGASGAIFGLFMAYGKLFKDRIIYFMMVFPMKMKTFIWILVAIEVGALLSGGLGSGSANLAHLGGLIVGLSFLKLYPLFKRRKWKASGQHLSLVVDNEDSDSRSPKKWH